LALGSQLCELPDAEAIRCLMLCELPDAEAIRRLISKN